MALNVEDHLAIQELFSISNFRIDHFDAEGWADLFTEDGELIVDGVSRAKGRKGLIDYVLSRQKSAQELSHWTTNLWIEENAEGATAHAYVMAFDISRTIEVPFVLGEYHDELLKGRKGWKFKVKRMTARMRRKSQQN